VCDNCPLDANAGQEDSDTDGLGDVCDPEACCIPDSFSCFDRTQSQCDEAGGAFQGWDSDCADIQCDEVSVHIDSSRTWLYENFFATPTNCQVTFTAVIDYDPWQNYLYTYEWTIEAPTDRPLATFTEIAGAGTAQVTYASPERPGYSPSCLPYVVRCTITGVGVMPIQGEATYNIDVRLIADVDDSGCLSFGCTDADDLLIIQDVIDGNVTEPDVVDAADVNCDGNVNSADLQIADAIALDPPNGYDSLGNCIVEPP